MTAGYMRFKAKHLLDTSSVEDIIVQTTMGASYSTGPQLGMNTGGEIELSDDQISEYKEAFSVFDSDGDGVISRSEMKSIMNSLGQKPTDREVKELIRTVDIDGNGVIDFKEFLMLVSQKDKEEGICEEEVFDDQGTGFIEVSALKIIMERYGKLPKEEIRRMVAIADPEESGTIEYHDFVRLMLDQ